MHALPAATSRVAAGTVSQPEEQAMEQPVSDKPILCPSAQPDFEDAKVFGVMIDTPEAGMRVGYLTEAQPITPDIVAAAQPARPSEVLRIASPCMGSGCVHFDGSDCKLASRLISMLDPVVSGLPHCVIRPSCRWFRQEGRAACLRCPQVVTELRDGTDLQRQVAGAAPPA
jgi:hypothetical protein